MVVHASKGRCGYILAGGIGRPVAAQKTPRVRGLCNNARRTLWLNGCRIKLIELPNMPASSIKKNAFFLGNCQIASLVLPSLSAFEPLTVSYTSGAFWQAIGLNNVPFTLE